MNPRDAVIGLLTRQAKRFPDLDLAPVDVTGLSPRDAALARAIDHAVRRRWLTLVAMIDHCLDQDWYRLEPNVQAPLLAGAAQLLLLDRIPEHAAINESVNWMKTHGRAKAGGLVNAVLRKVAGLRQELVDVHDPNRSDELPLHDGRAWRLTQSVFSDDPAERLAGQTSCPIEVIRHWRERDSEAQVSELARHALVHAPIIIAGVDTTLANEHPQLTLHDRGGFAVYHGPGDELKTLLDAHPDLRVQDPTPAEAVEATRQQSPELIVDVCAGRGTKTRQLALLHPDADIVATDINPERLAALRLAFKDHARVKVADFSTLREHDGRADLLVLDVPCSNSGVLARRVEARYRLSGDTVASLVGIQRQLIADTIPLLSPSGRLLYSTCSVEPEENQNQAEWIVRWHRLRVGLTAERVPQGLPGEGPEQYVDGGYFALLEM